ncbi:MAG: 2-amino-4-hydroxy-6-hydroxymethyldihydropteridine diphosphokinase, partial [Candidatus Omnitrophota bacterium]
MATAYIGIGSNLGERQANIDRALALLKEDPEIRILKISHFIETDPVGGPADAPKYLNGALSLDTELLPLE